MAEKFKVIDGDDTLYFDTEAERDAYMSQKPTVWDKDAYERELNAAHDRWFEAIYLPLEYKSAEEIALWEDDEEFAEEANSLKGLYKTSWLLVKAHLATVTEVTANVDAFIQSLPNFEPAP